MKKYTRRKLFSSFFESDFHLISKIFSFFSLLLFLFDFSVLDSRLDIWTVNLKESPFDYFLHNRVQSKNVSITLNVNKNDTCCFCKIWKDSLVEVYVLISRMKSFERGIFLSFKLFSLLIREASECNIIFGMKIFSFTWLTRGLNRVK